MKNDIIEKKIKSIMTIPVNFQWASIPQILVSLFLVIQGVVVLIQKPKNRLHQTFFLFQLPIALWLISMGVAYMQEDANIALFLVKLGFLGVMFIPVSTYAFTVFFLGDKKQDMVIYIGIFITSFFGLFINEPSFTRGVVKYSWGYYIYLGPLSMLSVVLFLIFVPLFIRNLYLKYKSAPLEQKRWHLLALVMGCLAFLAGIDFLPAYGFVFTFIPLGFILVGSFVTLMGYFMLRHHLSDLKIIFGRSVGYIVLTIFLFLIYTSFFIIFFPLGKSTGEIFFNSVFFIIGLYVVSFIKQKSQKVVDEIFFKEKIDYQELITEFNSDLRNLTDTKTFLKIFFTFVRENLRIQNSYIFIYSEKEKSWIIYDGNSEENEKPKQKDAPLDEDFKNYFSLNQKLIDARDYSYHPMLDDTRRQILEILREYRGKILLPLMYRSSFCGLIIFGEKFSGENYTYKDTHSLINLATPVSIAWENAKLFENIQYSSKLKTDFVSIASHQLRTPLSGLRWSLQMLVNKELGPLNTDQDKLVKDMYSTSARMIEIVSQLLDVVHIEEDKSKTFIEIFKLQNVVGDVMREKSGLIREKNLEIEYKISKNIPDVSGNLEYTKTVISILVDNAIRYSRSRGKITLSAISKDGKVAVSVKDTGIGIPKIEQENIFNKFFRASNAQSLEPNGSGLGLFYAKTLIEKQGGEIWFRSPARATDVISRQNSSVAKPAGDENKGTVFYFTLLRSKKV